MAVRNSWSVGEVLTAGDLTDTFADKTNNKNLLYNGAMQVHQRGTSATGLTTGDYRTADRWKIDVGAGTWTNTVESDAPTGSGFRNSLKVLCSTAKGSLASGDYGLIRQILEGQDVQRIAKGTVTAQQLTLSFWVKSNITGTFVAEMEDFDNGRVVSGAYSVNASATWEKKSIVFPADSSGALDNDNAASFGLHFWLLAGSSFTSGTLGTTWHTTTTNRAVGQTNLAAATNNYWQITGVQLEVGPTATGFEFKSFGQELRECQRYYQKSYGESVALGSVTDDGAVLFDNVGGGTRTTVYLSGSMRSNVAVTFYNPVTGASGSIRNTTSGTNVSYTGGLMLGTRSFAVDSGVIASGAIAYFHYAASAEL